MSALRKILQVLILLLHIKKLLYRDHILSLLAEFFAEKMEKFNCKIRGSRTIRDFCVDCEIILSSKVIK